MLVEKNLKSFHFIKWETVISQYKSRGILAAQGIESPPKSTFYYNQKKVNATIIELCQESLKKEEENMAQNTIIALDRSYAHRRNSPKIIYKSLSFFSLHDICIYSLHHWIY